MVTNEESRDTQEVDKRQIYEWLWDKDCQSDKNHFLIKK